MVIQYFLFTALKGDINFFLKNFMHVKPMSKNKYFCHFLGFKEQMTL